MGVKIVQNIAEVTIRNSSKKDREINYDQFKQVINFLHNYKKGRYAFSKMQGFLMYIGMSGFRPGHVSKARLEWLLFDNRKSPTLGVVDTKHIPKKIKMGNTDKWITVKYEDWDEHEVSSFCRDYFEEYIRRNWATFVNNYLFPSKNGQVIVTKVWDHLLSKLRQQMISYDPVKYSWVNEVVKYEYNGVDSKTGKVRPARQIRRLSLYSFRKANITWYTLALIDKGIKSDIPLHVAQYAGHSAKSMHHIYRYIKTLVAGRVIDGSLELKKPPNLNENFLGVDNPMSDVDRWLGLLIQHPAVREAIGKALSEIKRGGGKL